MLIKTEKEYLKSITYSKQFITPNLTAGDILAQGKCVRCELVNPKECLEPYYAEIYQYAINNISKKLRIGEHGEILDKPISVGTVSYIINVGGLDIGFYYYFFKYSHETYVVKDYVFETRKNRGYYGRTRKEKNTNRYITDIIRTNVRNLKKFS